MFSLNYLHKISITDVPLQWMTRIELFSSDLEQFPLMYVHLLVDKEDVEEVGEYNPDVKQRMFGFVLTAKWGEPKDDDLCDIEIEFVCNIPQNHHPEYDNAIAHELSHRIGLADRIGFAELDQICKSSPDSLPLLQTIWNNHLKKIYGKYIPHGRIFDEMYGIVRFSASGMAPKSGKTSEYRMLYWYVKDLGEPVKYADDANNYSFLEFYLLPTYKELVDEKFEFFKNFSDFFVSTKDFWKREYTESFTVDGHVFKCAEPGAESLPSNAESFTDRYASKLGDNYNNISTLRQIFNRMPGRLYGYIWNIMTPTTTDYRSAFKNRENFQEFYKIANGDETKGVHPKVVACFIQQAFGLEALPIDTWVKTFIFYPLGYDPHSSGRGSVTQKMQKKLYSDYCHLDKIEKLIWACSMGNKTNKTGLTEVLWCQRYGTDRGDKGPCRGANPLSCSKCELRNQCLSYSKIKDETIYVSDNEVDLKSNMQDLELFYGVHTVNNTPRTVYTLEGTTKSFKERDSHTGLGVEIETKIPNGSLTVDAFVRKINESID